MTVEHVSESPDIDCVWLNDKKETKRGQFDQETLTKVDCPTGRPLGMFIG